MVEPHPLGVWMEKNHLDDEALSKRLLSSPHPDSIRLIRQGHRKPGWDFAFELETITGISAHELRDPKWYGKAA